MTTRRDLEREREALIALRESAHVHCMDEFMAPLTASIARLDALLSLTDEQCAYLAEHCGAAAEHDDALAADFDYGTRQHPPPSVSASAHRTVADLVRRTS